MSQDAVVQRPGTATASDGRDLLAPTRAFLNGLGLMPDLKNPDKTEAESTPVNNALEITKSADSFAKMVTGAGGGVSLIAGIFAATTGKSDVVVAALAITTAIIIAAGILAVARVADGDVRSRAALAGDKITCKADVVRALLASYDVIAKPSIAASSASGKPDSTAEQELKLTALSLGAGARVKTSHGTDTVKGFRWSKEDGLEVQLTGGDYIGVARLLEVSK